MVARLWRLVEALQARRRGATVQQLMETVSASRATVYRDLGLLQEAGVPMTHEAVNGEVRYALARDALPALRPNALQLAALLLARQFLGPLDGTRLIKELDGLIATRATDPTDPQVHLGPRTAASTKTLVETIDRAMRNGRRLRIQYRAASTGRTTWRIVEPAGLRLVDRHLYLVAWDPEKRSWRTFKAVRLLFAHDLDEPVGEMPALDEDALFRTAVKVWNADPVDVEVRLEADVGWLAPEWPLHPEQTIRTNADGSVSVFARVAGIIEAMRWCLAWGRSAQVVRPAELRRMLTAELEGALAGYVNERAADRVVSRKVRRARGTLEIVPGRRKVAGRNP